MDVYQRLLLGTIIPWLNPNQQPATTTSFWPISSFHIYHHLYQALNVFFTSSKTPLFNPLTHDGSMVLLYMVTWIPSIYPRHVSIYTSTMDPSWAIKWDIHDKFMYTCGGFLKWLCRYAPFFVGA